MDSSRQERERKKEREREREERENQRTREKERKEERITYAPGSLIAAMIRDAWNTPCRAPNINSGSMHALSTPYVCS